MNQLSDDFIDVSLWFAKATDGILYAIIDNQGNDLRLSDPELIELVNLRPFSEVFIPWFTDTEEMRDENNK